MPKNQDEIFADVFSDSAPKQPEAAPAPAPVREPEPAPAPEPVAQKEAVEPTPPVVQPAPVKEPERPRIDPEQFKGYLDEREKRQQAERELAELRRQSQQQQPKEPIPDVLDNPEGYRQHLKAEYDKSLMQMKVQQSEFMATRDYGADVVKEVSEWARRLDDASANRLLAHASPMHAAVEAFRQEKASAVLKEYDYDLEKMKAKWLADLQGQQAQTGGQANPQSPALAGLPPKIAGTGGSLGKAPAPSEDQIFRSVFSR